MDPRNLAQEIAGGVGGDVLRVEDNVDGISRPKLNAIISLQQLALDALAINESSVLAALVNYEELPVLRNDESMVAGNPGIGNYQVLVHLSTDGKRTMVEIQGSLLSSLHEDQTRENA